MIRFIRYLFTRHRQRSPSHAPDLADVTYVKPPDLDFAELENNFDKRTFSFHWYEKRLGRKNPRLLNWIGSVDYSGYVREKCLRYLIANYESGDENRILLRLGDWVPEIQEIATRWTKASFPELTIEQIDANHRLILFLSRKKRLSDSEGIQTINRCLLEKVEKLHRNEFYALNANLRRYLYLLGVPGNARLRQLMLDDNEPFNRLLILRLFDFDELTNEEIETLKRDRSTLVKRHFVRLRIDNNVKPSQQELTDFALDQHKGIRETARYYLREYYGIDAYDLYKQRKDDKFYYIADYAKKEDIDYFLEGTRSGDKGVRYLCLKAVCNIDSEYLRGLDLKQLILVNRKFRDLLSQHLPLILSLSELKEYRDTLSQATPNGTLVYLNMVFRKSYWHFIDLCLSLIIDDASEKNINFLRHRIYSKTYVYGKLPLALKASITNEIDTLRNVEHYRLQELLTRIEFAVRNA
jgi:hypothetical protein